MFRSRRFLTPILILHLLFLAGGCGKSLPATIEGSITIDGQSLSDSHTVGEVMYFPTGGGAAAMGAIEPGGKYSISTGATKGLEPGTYKISVRVAQVPPPPPGGYENAPPQKVISPGRYQDKEQSGLVEEVKPGKNVIDLDLSSK